MDPREIVPVKLTMSQIRDIAEDFRKNHIFNDSIPVDIELVIEATMGIRVIPIESLQKACDMDGFISRDLNSVYVDKVEKPVALTTIGRSKLTIPCRS